MGAELIPVRVRDCACPETPHEEGDLVYMAPTVGLELGMAAEMDMSAVGDYPEDRKATALMAKWGVTYVLYGAVGWNLEQLDDKGRREPRPFDPKVLLDDYTLGKPVADKGADLYGPVVMAPFLEAATKAIARRTPPSSNGSTRNSTSRDPVSIRSPRKSSSAPSTDGPLSVIAR
jgi:hypothetical protein